MFNKAVFDPIRDMKIGIKYDIPVTTDFNSRYRYVLFLELMRFLYDFLSATLLVKRNYYQTFVKKSEDLQEFYENVNVQKKDLHLQNEDLVL